MKNKKISIVIILLLCIIPVFSVGYSLWIIIEELNSKNNSLVVPVEVDSTFSFVYDGENISIGYNDSYEVGITIDETINEDDLSIDWYKQRVNDSTRMDKISSIFKNVGIYYGYVNYTYDVIDENNNLSSYTSTLSIVKLIITPKILNVLWYDDFNVATTYQYNGSYIGPKAQLNASEIYNTDDVQVSTELFINAGKHNAKAILVGTDKDNYTINTNIEKEYEIVAKPISISYDTTTLIYNKQIQHPIAIISSSDLVNGDEVSAIYSQIDGTSLVENGVVGKDVGSYKITSSSNNSNYVFISPSNVCEYVITSKVVSVSWNSSTFVYNGVLQSPTASYASSEIFESDIVNLSYSSLSGASNITGGSLGIDIGTYNLTVSSENLNYVISEETKNNTYKITAKSITLEWSYSETIYNGNNQVPSVSFESGSIYERDNVSVENISLTKKGSTVSLIDGSINANDLNDEEDKYQVTSLLGGVSSANYKIDNSSHNYVILKATPTINIEIVDRNGNPYENNTITFRDDYLVDVEILGIKGETLSMSYSTLYDDSASKPSNKGTYEVLITLTRELTNYKVSSNSINLIINPKSISSITVNGLETEYEYTGREIIPNISLYDGEILLVKDTDYTLNCESNFEAGNALLIINGINNYTESLEKSFTIILVEDPISNYEVDFELNSGTLIYNGSEHKPKPTHPTLVEGIDYTLRYVNNIDAGTATVFIDGAKHHPGTISKTFIISKREITLSSETLEINYDANYTTWESFQKAISSTLRFSYEVYNSETNENEEVIVEEIKENISIPYMHNNMYSYGTIAGFIDPYTLGTNKIVGSTYASTVTLSSTQLENYIVLSPSGIEYTDGAISLRIKYRTVKINSAYWTIEEALAKTGDIITVGDSSDESSFVITAFTKISGIYATTFNLIKRTLTITYNSDGDDYERSETSGGNVYSALIIPDTVTINLTNSASFIVGAHIGFKQPNSTIVCTHGVVMNYGTINIESGCHLKSYGYTKGSGTINLRSGSTATDCMATYDWPGGNISSSIKDKVMPVNAWTVHNISCETNIYANATYQAYVYVKVSILNADATVIIIGNSSASNSIFKTTTTNTTGYIRKYVTKSLNWSDTNASYLALSSITGSNQIFGQRDVIEIYGDYEDSILSIAVTGASMQTSTSIAAPISSIDIILKSGTDLLLSKSDYMLLPGSSIVIEKGATATIEPGVDVSVTTNARFEEQYVNNASNFYKICVDKYDAKLIVSGTLKINGGNVGGKITAGEDNATITMTESSGLTSTYKTLNTTSASPYYLEDTLTLNGILYGDSSSSNLEKTTYIAKDGKWFKPNNISYSTGVEGMNIATIALPTNYALTNTELPTLSREHYIFDGWYVGENKITAGTIVTSNMELIAKWIPLSPDISFDSNGGSEINNIINVTYGEVYGELPTPTLTGYTFKGWYLGNNLIDENTIVNVSTNHQLKAKWEVNKYTITFDADGGNVENVTKLIEYGASYSTIWQIAERPTFKFLGWYNEEDIQVFETDIYTLLVDSTLKAKWEAVDTYVTIIFDSSGGSKVASVTRNYGDDATYGILPTPTLTGHDFLGWYDEGDNKIESTTVVPKLDTQTLKAKWAASTYNVTFSLNGGVQDVTMITVTYGGIYESLPTPIKEGYIFVGWTLDSLSIEEDTVVSATSNHELVANYRPKEYVVEYNTNGGNTLASKVVNYGSTFGELATPTKEGYQFDSWKYNEEVIDSSSIVSYDLIDGAVITLSAVWTEKNHIISIVNSSNNDAKLTLYIYDWDGNEVSNETITVVASGSEIREIRDGYYIKVTEIDNTEVSDSKYKNNYKVTGVETITVTASCIAEGTLITLADGTKKKVEDITGDDIILVFNHETGKFDYSKMLFITHKNEGAKLNRVITLNFDDGSSIRIIVDHGFFDLTIRKYIYISESNIDEFINHEFANVNIIDGEFVSGRTKLISYEITEEVIRVFCPVTAYHMNCYAEGLLTTPSIPFGVTGLVNIYEYDEDMKYNEELMKQDIEKYGIFTYEEFADYISYEAYMASPAVHLKVSIGKGYMTYEEILLIFEYLLSGELIT